MYGLQTPPPNTLTPGLLPPLRTTCDNCARSKVRCGKEIPNCRRCILQGVHCSYSRSRRTKKPSGNANSLPESPIYMQKSSSGVDLMDAIGFAQQEDCRVSEGEAPGSPEHVQLIGLPSEMADNSGAASTSMPLTDHSFTSTVDLGDEIINWQTMSPSFSLGDMDDLGVSNDLDFSTLVAAPLQMDDTWMAAADKGLDPVIQSGAGGVEAAACSASGCAYIGAALLQQLQAPCLMSPSSRAHRKGGDSGTFTTAMTNGPTQREIDTVIKVNRAALDDLHRVLDCACSAPGCHGAIVTAVLTMVLFWYETCLQLFNDSDAGSSSSGRKAGSEGAGRGSGIDSERGTRISSSSGSSISFSNSSRGPATGGSHASSGGVNEIAPWELLDGPLPEHGNPPAHSVPPVSISSRLICAPSIRLGFLQVGAQCARQVIGKIILDELEAVWAVVRRLEECADQDGGSADGFGFRFAGGMRVQQECEVPMQFSLMSVLHGQVKRLHRMAQRTME